MPWLWTPALSHDEELFAADADEGHGGNQSIFSTNGIFCSNPLPTATAHPTELHVLWVSTGVQLVYSYFQRTKRDGEGHDQLEPQGDPSQF